MARGNRSPDGKILTNSLMSSPIQRSDPANIYQSSGSAGSPIASSSSGSSHQRRKSFSTDRPYTPPSEAVESTHIRENLPSAMPPTNFHDRSLIGSYRADDLAVSHDVPFMNQPPGLTTSQNSAFIVRHEDDSGTHIGMSSSNHPDDAFQSMPFAPTTRPSILRRALSDYDAKSRSVPPAMHRSFSTTSDLDRSPKRGTRMAEIHSPSSPRTEMDSDASRMKKSPRKSPHMLPAVLPPEPLPLSSEESRTDIGDHADTVSSDELSRSSLSQVSTPAAWHDNFDDNIPDFLGDAGLVDEGDMLPNVDFQMDVTFDDEGLNTLERIFLLSKSEYPFHRAYVARVLGDLLSDVDPCESVEYVLPLLSGFSMDDDESVKEAFASELHRILWYFYSTCRLVQEDIQAVGDIEYEPKRETMTITSEGLQVVPKPSAADVIAVPEIYPPRRASILSTGGPSSTGSSLSYPASSMFSTPTEEGDTPISTISDEPSSQSTAFSPEAYVNPYADDASSEKGWAKDVGPLMPQPTLAINFFTPLLGSLLLNENPGISDSVRLGVVHLMGRLHGNGVFDREVWGKAVEAPEPDERRTFASQSGPHAHDLRPFTSLSKAMIEAELIEGIILGMGKLATEMPESLFARETLNSGSGAEVASGDDSSFDEEEAFRSQLVQEATAGRATSVNLIGSICECYTGQEIVERGFFDEVLRSKDGDVAVRAEAAVALSNLAKNAPPEYIYEIVSMIFTVGY